MISPVGNNSSLSSFLSSLTEDKEVTTFEIVSDNARSMSDLHFSPEPKEAKCRWKNLVRMDSDDDMMRHVRRGSSTRSSRGGGRNGGGVGRRPSLTFSSSDRTRSAFARISSDPLLMPRRTLSPERVTGNRAYSTTNLLRMPQRKPSPRTDRSSLLSSSSDNNNANASWGVKTKQEKKNMFLEMMMTPDLHQLESSSSNAVSSKPTPVDKPISPPRRSQDDSRNISDDESDVKTVGSTADYDGEMSNELKGGSDMVTWKSETHQRKMVASKALLMEQNVDGFPAGNKMKKMSKNFDKIDPGLQSKAKMYGLY